MQHIFLFGRKCSGVFEFWWRFCISFLAGYPKWSEFSYSDFDNGGGTLLCWAVYQYLLHQCGSNLIATDKLHVLLTLWIYLIYYVLCIILNCVVCLQWTSWCWFLSAGCVGPTNRGKKFTVKLVFDLLVGYASSERRFIGRLLVSKNWHRVQVSVRY